MDELRIQYIPVTKNGALYGIINMLDLVKHRLSQLDAEAAALRAYVTGSAIETQLPEESPNSPVEAPSAP